MRHLAVIILLFLSLFSYVHAEPVKWNISHKSLGNNEYELTFKGKIEPGYTVYSMYTPEGGPMATSLSFEKGVEPIDTARENIPHKKFDSIFEVDVYYFENEYIITQRVRVTDVNIHSIVGSIGYQVCQAEQCMVFDKKFDVPLESKSTIKQEETKADENLFWFFCLGIGYGLLAIVMPCVFPMIPMTVSFFMHGDASKAKARSKALFFALSIVGIFTCLGIIVSIFLGPDFVNWLSTNWLPNIIFFIMFMLFAASFFGAFEIVLPSWLVNKSDKQADKGGYVGAFFMAFTLVLVSFSCTAPFVGNLLVEAARGGILRPIIGMLGFSIALALPFGFFAFFPSRLSSLPKSGGWLNSVKIIFGFIEIALGFKFLMVADQTYHWNLLDREVYIAIWIAVFLLLGIYLMGKIKFKNDSDVQYIGVFRLICIIITFSFVIYLVPGMFGAPLKALAGYLPPQETIDFDINRIMREEADRIIEDGIAISSAESALCESPKYADKMRALPHGLKGYWDFDQALKCAKEQNKPLFIDFTGHGCANCREMEQTVWADKDVLDILKKGYVLVTLYVDDKLELPESEWYTSDYDGNVKKTIGKQNADFQIKHFHSNAQPNYILLDSRSEDSVLMNRMLAPSKGYDKDVDSFVRFLNQGKEEYQRKNKLES